MHGRQPGYGAREQRRGGRREARDDTVPPGQHDGGADGHEVLDLLPQVYGERGSRPVPRVRLQQRGGEADPLLSRELLQPRAPDYRSGHDPAVGLISPVFADLSDLPPLIIQAGTHEVLLDQASRRQVGERHWYCKNPVRQ
jgi:acetyl esterase/lipase